MSVERFEELLNQFEDNTLSHEEASEFFGALENSEAFQHAFADRMRLVSCIKQIYDVRHQAPKIMAKAHRNLRVSRKTSKRSSFATGFAAAAAVIVVAVLVYVYKSTEADKARDSVTAMVAEIHGAATLRSGTSKWVAKKGNHLAPGDSVKTAADSDVSLQYPDGTRLDIGSGTELTLLELRENPQKLLRMKTGELRAHVAKQPVDQPLLIETPEASVRVVGTRFVLNADSVRARLDVTEGRVQVARTANGVKEVVLVSAGEFSIASADTALFAQKISATSTFTLGETEILATNDSGKGGLLVAQPVTLAQTATIQSLSFYVTRATGRLRLGIYDASGPNGGPGVKKAETGEIEPVGNSWNTAHVLTPVALTPCTYWLAFLPCDKNLGFRKGPAQSTESKSHNYPFGEMPATFPIAPNSSGCHWSIYATFSSDEAK